MKKDVDAAKDLGLIEIKLYRALVSGSKERRCGFSKKNELEFAEKSLKGKAISHGVS